ncbi:hypothetical protein H8S37_13020 [Mediterraneibacter sp. NSJ-55]|uniref:DUF6673 domain-containing protein n=1 Tax=Mediterraneibacter hominis TaxID=2763054 RepID=A0A923LJF5_9FIRM|nr:DUF6673 family protein [Mediterraneibacter hominis]MBC5689831.1 hypothetical protein [Mediterraneibacter hominis]
MSLWKFEGFETEIDFTDADFLEKLEAAQGQLDQESKNVPKVGKSSDIVRGQIACFERFYDRLFGEGAGRKILEGKNSLEHALHSIESLTTFYEEEGKRVDDRFNKYYVKIKGNKNYGGYQKGKKGSPQYSR